MPVYHDKNSLSQNFIKFKGLVTELINASNLTSKDQVVEIGPGKGIITTELIKKVNNVIAVEKDETLAASLISQFQSNPNIKIFNQDFLKFNLPLTPYKVFSNIPFSITAEIVSRIMKSPVQPDAMYFIMQQEAADKFVGIPNETQSSILIKPWYQVKILGDIDRTNFTQKPQVKIVFVEFIKREKPFILNADLQDFRDFVIYGFNQWQATLIEAYKKILAGADLFRFNLKHNDFEWHRRTIKKARTVAEKLNRNLGIIVDFQGPELRIETKNQEPIEINEGESIVLAKKFLETGKSIVLSPVEVVDQIEEGETVFINDGELELKVISKNKIGWELKSSRNYVIGNRKSMNIPGKNLDVPLFTKKDLDILNKINYLKPDFVALSFVRSAKDVNDLREILDKKKCPAKIVAKIENAHAVENLEEIIINTDAVMVARGDLGIEVPLMELAYWQKRIIDLSRKYSTTVIVATQMLQSMVTNFKPTRAEATDVANAIFDGSDAVMLSEETAIGRHPVSVVSEMDKIAGFCERHGNIKEIAFACRSLTEVLVDAAVKIIKNPKDFPIKAVVVFTKSGNSAKVLSRYRLKIPIIAITNNEVTEKNLSLSYGVNSYLNKFKKGNFQINNPIFKNLLKFEFINKGDNILIIHGNNWMDSGTTSDISLVRI